MLIQVPHRTLAGLGSGLRKLFCGAPQPHLGKNQVANRIYCEFGRLILIHCSIVLLLFLELTPK